MMGMGKSAHRPTMFITFAILAFLLLIGAIGLLLYWLIIDKWLHVEKENEKEAFWGCTSLECSLNSALNPCDDFYEFVCSGFMNNTGRVPEGFSTKSQFNILWHRSWNDLIGILGNQTIRQTASTQNPLFRQMFLFYDSCLDGPGRETNRSQGLLAHLAEANIEPGTLRQFNTEWLLKAFPFVPFFNLESTWDVRPETEEGKSMFLFMPKKTLTNYGQFKDAAKREEFVKKMQKLLGYLMEDDLADEGKKPVFFKRGLSNEEYAKDIQRRVQNLIQMELRIGEILDSSSSQENQEWTRFSNLSRPERYTNLSALGQLYSPHSLDWLQLLRQFGPFVPANELEPSSQVIVLGHELLLAYGQMIEKLEVEEPQMLSDYLDWALIWPILFELDSRFTTLLEEPWTPVKNERICIRDFVRFYFRHLLDILYVHNVFDKELIGKNRHILSFVKNGFSELLDEADWMDAEWKKKAKLKLANLKDYIGYFATIIEDDELLARLYAKYAIKEGMPWAQMYANVHRQFYLWPVMDYQSSYWVDGYYKWVYNSLAIYAGIIHPPWFDPSLPAVINFGAMGTFMGHEVTHGYDSQGWHFDERGKLRSMGEAESGQEMMQKMGQRMECFLQQYGQYGAEGQRPNGQYFTLAENIADNGAIRASYKAWQQFKAANPEEARRKPGGFEQFTDEQLLFISSAFMYCSQMPEKDAAFYVMNDNHAFPRSRVNLPLRNFNAFAQAFGCPIGSQMNPAGDETKCRLW